jgi:hypothetical protein
MRESVAVGVLLLSVSAAAGAQAAPPTVVESMGWLSGCWGGEHGSTTFREIWTVAAPDLMIGLNVTTQPSKPAQFEYLRIERRDGQPAYVAQPGGAPPTAFARDAGSSTPDTAVFGNPRHDFPKRVGYRRVEPNGVLAWIDGGASGEGRVEYPMKRAACPAAP